MVGFREIDTEKRQSTCGFAYCEVPLIKRKHICSSFLTEKNKNEKASWVSASRSLLTRFYWSRTRLSLDFYRLSSIRLHFLTWSHLFYFICVSRMCRKSDSLHERESRIFELIVYIKSLNLNELIFYFLLQLTAIHVLSQLKLNKCILYRTCIEKEKTKSRKGLRQGP